jgi:DNA phosphorothioation system restriction enzyme
MPLTVLDLKPEYRSDHNSLLEAFFRPCLRRSVRYDRAVGFFASSSLGLLADGLDEFLENGGAIRLIASPKLDAEDVRAMTLGYEERQRRAARAVTREIEHLREDPAFRPQLELLAWLIANERLDIKLAIVGTSQDFGMYHEKLGVFVDDDDNFVAFAGSANESYGGFVANFESVDVYCSWLSADAARAAAKRQAFERLWRAETPSVEIYDFPDAARRSLIETAPRERPRNVGGAPTGTGRDGDLRRPTGFELRDYQAEAVRAWLANNGRGVFAMATGTGKTLTALTAASVVATRAREQAKPLVVVIVCPQKHLVTQWAKDVETFGVDPLLCFESSADWAPEAARQRMALDDERAQIAVWITTNATFASTGFQSQLDGLRSSLLLIADEMHNLGASRLRQTLPSTAAFRLGLSATPERRNDDEGTGALLDYFGDVVFELPLHEAVERGILTPYRYFPTIVELAGDELEQYVELSEKIARAMAGGQATNFSDLPPGVENLLFRRARLIGGARGKLVHLRSVIGDERDHHTLVYCSDSNVNGTDERQIDAVTALLGREMGMKVAQYTHETSTQLRTDRLRLFEEGRLDALIAIKCLDEGVDVPATRRAFILASSTNPRQYVQRRGRVLRRAPGKRRAEIHDFVVVPPEGALPPGLQAIERRLVARELTRVIEFAQHAENGPVAMNVLLPLQQRYDLLHV